MTVRHDDEFQAFRRAEEAAARGDLQAAERWTQLMERQGAVFRRMIDTMLKAGFDPVAVVEYTDTLPNRATRRAARQALRKG
jgi:hypothetical protein